MVLLEPRVSRDPQVPQGRPDLVGVLVLLGARGLRVLMVLRGWPGRQGLRVAQVEVECLDLLGLQDLQVLLERPVHLDLRAIRGLQVLQDH